MNIKEEMQAKFQRELRCKKSGLENKKKSLNLSLKVLKGNDKKSARSILKQEIRFINMDIERLQDLEDNLLKD